MAEVNAKPVKETKNGTDVPRNAEPSEIDPCIEFKQKSGRRKFLDDTESALKKKTGLSRQGLYIAGAVLLVLFLLLVTVIALGAAWPRTPHHHQFPVCVDSACLRASAQVREALNTSFSKCKDPWNWACGGWLSKHSLPEDRSIWNHQQQLAHEEAARIRDLVSTLPLPLNTGSVEWKLKHLYEACLEVDNVNADQARPLTTIISELGGWVILRNWNMVEFDLKEVLQHLHVKYGASPFFKVSVIPNPRKPGSNSIAIHPSGLGLPDRDYYFTEQKDPIQSAYKQLIRDVVLTLSTTKNDAEKFGNDIFHYEKRLAEIFPVTYDLLNPLNTYNPIKVSELKFTASTLPLQDILTAMFPESNITGDTEIIVTSPDYLTQVSQIVSSSDRAVLNNYLMWTLVRQYLPYLSEEFTEAVHSFQSELMGFHEPIKRWEVCANLVHRFMGLAIESMLEKKNPISADTMHTVKNMFENIRSTAEVKLDNFKITTDLGRHLSNKIAALNLQIGLPEATKNETYIKNYHNKLIILKANLFESFKYGIQFLKKTEEHRLKVPRLEDNLLVYALKRPPAVSFSAATNTIIIPRTLLIEPAFENKYPNAINYGRLGIQIAYAVMESLLPYKSAWGGDLKLLSPYHIIVNDSVDAISDRTTCLTNFIKDQHFAPDNLAEKTSKSTLKHLAAVTLAHEALKSVLKETAHVHQPALETFEDSALFFLIYAQSQCSMETKQQEMFDTVVNFKISQQSLFQAAWWQIPEFSGSLDCNFNNAKKCSDIF